MTTMRLALRVFINGALHSEQRVDVDASRPQALEALAEEHARLAGAGPVMVEIEFLDEPDVNQRFVRIGTDPRGMVQPIAIDLERMN